MVALSKAPGIIPAAIRARWMRNSVDLHQGRRDTHDRVNELHNEIESVVSSTQAENR